MSKIICDICGTKYPDTAEQCPICGYSNENAPKTNEMEENFLEDIIQEPRTKTKGGRFSKNNVRKPVQEELPVAEEEELSDKEEIPVVAPVVETNSVEEFDDEDEFEDEDEYDDDDEDDDEDEDEDEESGKKSGIILSILLTIVILALLCVSGFIFVQFVMPNLMASKDDVKPTETSVQTDAPETEEPTVPCAQLVLEQTDIELTEIGQMYLINVEAEPADTTDELLFASSDEAVVAVNEEGRITVVGEGTAVVTITCGAQTMECTVNVVLAEETEEPTEIPTEEPTEAPTEAPTEPLKDVKLEINGNTDVTFNARGLTFTFKLKNGLKNNEVTWTSENEKVCTIDENGFLTCTGSGKTNVIVRYGDQEVVIIVRVK